MPRASSSIAALVLVLAPLAACAPRAVIPEAERDRVTRDLDGQQRWLRVAAWAGPLWGDTGKVLLTEEPWESLDLVQTTGSKPIPPPPAERIVPPGTRVRIRQIEFPTGWLISKRVVMSPRYHPWVYVEMPGDPRPHVVVLSQTAASFDEVRNELDRLLSTDDPSPTFSALAQEQKDAILKKQLVEGMPPRAVEMAWGLPERKKIDRPAGSEEWIWPGGTRKAFLQDERLVRWESPPAR
jgi:hypothetical protein